MPPKDLDEYIWWLMDQKPELEQTPQDIKKDLHAQLAGRLDTLINSAILAAMPPSSLEEFDSILEKNDPAATQAFCEEKIPDLNEVVAKALLRFKEDYLGTV